MTYSQEAQDLFVVDLLKGMRNGYFVEIGAWDGAKFSNSLLLEQEYGWTGLLVECDAKILDTLKVRRPNCAIDTRAVWSKTGQKMLFKSNERGMLSGFKETLSHRKGIALPGIFYDVETVSFDDLLDAHNCPSHINYCSIDTEGSECFILEKFSFRRTFDVFTIEHLRDKDDIYAIMREHGYEPFKTFLMEQETAFVRKDLL